MFPINGPLLRSFFSFFQDEIWHTTLLGKIVLLIHVLSFKNNSFPNERLSTRTRSKTEAEGSWEKACCFVLFLYKCGFTTDTSNVLPLLLFLNYQHLNFLIGIYQISPCHELTFTDNGPHYHNTALLLYLAEVNATFNLTLMEYNNFEAGEGKTVLDTHFAHVSHKIVRWVRVGNNLDSGDQLANLLEV